MSEKRFYFLVDKKYKQLLQDTTVFGEDDKILLWNVAEDIIRQRFEKYLKNSPFFS